MSKIAKYSLLFSFAVILLSLTSCGKQVTNSNLLTGNPADPAFLEANQSMQQSSNNSQDAVFEGMDAAFDYFFPPPLAAQANTDTVIYTYENGWHHLIVNHINDTTGSSYYLDDSVQFKDTLGAVQQYPDTMNLGSVEVHVKRYLHIAQYDPYATFQFKGDDTVTAAALLVKNADDTTATFNGAAQEGAHGTFLHPDSGVECSLDAAVNHASYDLVFVINGNNCPLSGQLAASGSVNIVCPFSTDTLTISGSWTRTVNIGPNSVTIIAHNNTTRWILVIPKSQFCDNNPVVALDRLPGRFQP